MQEKQVTIGEQTFKLEEPFMVLATHDTYDYLKFLDTESKKIIENDGDMFDLKKVNLDEFKDLHLFDTLARKNLQTVFTYVEMMSE